MEKMIDTANSGRYNGAKETSMYKIYLSGRKQKTMEFVRQTSKGAIALALDWKAQSEYNVAEVYHDFGNGQCARIL